ncbi:MAG: hypothetical protein KDE27_05790, partial [Planctomycetes bacterium]|nr:hypothetical protein [Planctomycetota bacterium]
CEAAWTRVLQRGEPCAELRQLAGCDRDLDPRALRGALGAADESTRLRAAGALRRMLHLPLAAALQQRLADERSAAIRTALGLRPLVPVVTDDDVHRWLAQLDDDPGAKPPFTRSDQLKLTAGTRRELVRRLIAIARAAPVPDTAPSLDDLVTTEWHWPATRGPDPASTCLRDAAALGPEAWLTVLGLAVQSDSPWLRTRALCAAILRPMPPAAGRPAAGLVEALVASGDPVLEFAGAGLADRLLRVASAPYLEAAVRRRAHAALDADVAELELTHGPRGWCGTGRDGVGLPRSANAWHLLTAARLGDTALFAPLAAMLRAANESGASQHRWLLLCCLRHLAPKLDTSQAALLLPLLQRDHARPSALLYQSNESYHVDGIVDRLFAIAPATLVPWYRDVLFANSHRLHSAASALGTLTDPPLDRVRLIMSRLQANTPWQLLLRVPEVLADAPNDSLHEDSSALSPAVRRALAFAWLREFDRLRACERAGELPPDLAAALAAATPPTLAVLAELLPELPAPNRELTILASAIVTAPPAPGPAGRAADLAALRRLANGPSYAIAALAARRAATLGPEGHEFAAVVLDRLASSERHDPLRTAIRTSAELGIVLPKLPARLRRLVASPNGATEAGLAWLRLRPAWPPGFAFDRLAAIGHGRLEASMTELREAMHGDANRLVAVLGDGHPSTLRRALDLACSAADWNQNLEQAVLRQTLHADANVRLAAYRAVATRDAERCVAALLVHEGEFDPDPRIRALAADAPR